MKLTNPHELPGEAVLLHKIESEIANVFFYDSLVIVEGKPDAKVNYKTGFSLLVKGVNYIDHKPWVYISNRIHSYKPNVSHFKYLQLAPFLKGVAIVSLEQDEDNAQQLGGKYFKRPFKVFKELSEAYLWAQELLLK